MSFIILSIQVSNPIILWKNKHDVTKYEKTLQQQKWTSKPATNQRFGKMRKIMDPCISKNSYKEGMYMCVHVYII